MLIALKALHLLGLVLGLGFGLANIVIMRRMPGVPQDARPAMAALQKFNSRMGFGGIIILWVTGLWLFLAKYAGASLSGAFHAKLAAVVVLTGLAAWAQWLLGNAARTKQPPPSGTMRLIGMTVPALAAVAAALAVVTFN